MRLRFLGVALAGALILVLPSVLFGAEGSFDRSLRVSGPVDLDVSTGSGHIRVRTGESGTVQVHAVIKARDHWGGPSAEEKVHRIEANPPIEQDGSVIRVGHLHDSALSRNVSIDYDLVVPPDTRLRADSGSGDQSVEGIRGPLKVETGSGRIDATHIGGEVHASTGSGDIRLDSIQGGVTANTGSGSIRATGVAGEFSGETGSGDIHLEQTAAGLVKASSGSGRIELAGVKGPLRANTGSGDIAAQGALGGDWRLETGSGAVTINLPENASFDLRAHTDSGRISTKVPVTTQGTISRNDYQGRAGSGGYLLEVKTSSGDIRIE
ncbi:MAG TPA: DUF4097 family beta strand repeat-containing protein [Terriglobia bacterium]|nr:DUF4097 family beta strand repeat-containing protein [Terriglobia bacterium]